jgi:hypothetical protein
MAFEAPNYGHISSPTPGIILWSGADERQENHFIRQFHLLFGPIFGD